MNEPVCKSRIVKEFLLVVTRVTQNHFGLFFSGEVLGVLGENGGGQENSTLLKIMQWHLTPKQQGKH